MSKEVTSKSRKNKVAPVAEIEELDAPVSVEEVVKEAKKAGSLKVTRKNVDFDDIRSHFSFKHNEIYLNNAAMAPISDVARQATIDLLDKMYSEPGFLEREYEHILEGARQTVAAYLNTNADNIAFAGSASYAMNMLAMRIKRMDKNRSEIVTMQDEFPSSTIPFKRLGFKLNFVRPENDNHYDVAQIMRKVDKDRTAAVVLSLVEYRTGARFDQLNELAEQLHEVKVPLFINASEAAGLLPLDVSKIHISGLVFCSQKWLLAGPGAAVLYVPPFMRGEGFPPIAGWRSSRNPCEYNNHHLFPAKEAKAIELGTNSLLPIVSLEASIKLLNKWNPVVIRERVLDLTGQLIEGLNSKGARVITPMQRSQQAGIVSVLRSDADEFVAKLAAKGIFVAARGMENKANDRVVRVSPHFYNTTDEIITFLENW